MAGAEELNFESLEEDESIELAADQRRIYTQPADPEVDSLWKKWKRGKLDIHLLACPPSPQSSTDLLQ
jgi:hypothetical protein